ncbi:MAG: rhamnulokinase [Longibaculum muris]|uniref:Rhamnulokinase n=1 Tax=Longibaculum muris TaxID=1796628 RepID=A0A4R3ZAB3_9FIRM|nr:rhamnulokinase [Longibaculum muris]KXU49009.1 rhamnulokinase [Candidatus Stoquefichus sp. KLE1796]MBS5370348.1 rhamnulokinase [Coprobacillus cateniformis]MCR1886772.1 rhamnulokinase [Longibaculum muris]MED9810568.1 rhamnulokinase [Longibaculum muris]TCW02801.1 rhamnulokinase [Longibaculum muris]
MKYFLAIDIGASSGRHILCFIEEGKMKLEEVYRFENNVQMKNQHYYWNIDYLFGEVVAGIKACVKCGKVPTTLGIDTWAVDYALLDNRGQRIDEIYAYRDNRVDKLIHEKVNQKVFEDIYQKTGIQFQKFNTLYQLASDNDIRKTRTVDFLMVPDYLNYLLTGKKVNEYTNMSTTQLLDIETHQLSKELIDFCEVDEKIFQKMVMPGTSLGSLSEDMQKVIGTNIEVVVPATHDTGSAYMAAIEDNSVILSSGTWSLLGIETKTPYVSEKARVANFTNEGGYDYRYRFLKNIMGLWIIQEVSRNLGHQYSFAKLVEEARRAPFDGIFDVNDDRFLKPESMILEIKSYFEERHQMAPQSVGEIAYCVYHSLAHCYKEAIEELEDITGKHFDTINIIGGGCQNELLNEMIAKVCKRKVVAGPIEATALGNILAQLIQQGVVNDLSEGRQLIKASFEVKEYKGGQL